MNTSWTRSALAVTLSTLLAACNSGGGSAGNSHNGIDSNTPDTNKQPSTAALTPVDFNRLTDSALQSCIADTGIEYQEQLQLLECPHLTISTLTGLEQFTEIRVLNLTNNRLQSVAELQGMSKLAWLDISHNQLNDINYLHNLTQLTSLQASHNQLNSIDTLQLTKLNKLYINDNQLSSLNFIGTLPALKHLTAHNNPSTVPGSIPETLETFSI